MKTAQEKLEELQTIARGILGMTQNRQNKVDSMVGRITAQNRDASDHETTLIDEHNTAIAANLRELEVVNAEIAELEAEIRNSTPMPRQTQPDAPRYGPGHSPQAVSYRPTSSRTRTGQFGNVFVGRQIADPYAGRFTSFGEFALAVADGGRDQRLMTNATMRTDLGSAGGYLIPPGFLGPILDESLTQEVIRPNANVLPMMTPNAMAGVFDYSDGTSGKRGGLQLAWGKQAEQMSEQRGLVKAIGLTAHKANIFCRVSAELVEDVPLFDQQLGNAIVAATAAGLDIAFLTGTGAGMPLGIITASSTITVAKEGSQASSTLLLPNIAKMMARLSPASFSRAVWMIHPTVVVPLYTMSVVVQNVAGTENVGGSTAAAVTVDASGQLRIFGRPCVVTDACAPLGTLGDIVLADLSKYLVGLRAEAVIKRDDSKYFDSDEIAFKMTLRVDGMPADKSATTLRDGTNTTAPFVILQAR